MKQVTFSSIREAFRQYNEEHHIQYGMSSNVPDITAIVVYKQSNFTKPYSETERSYRVDNRGGKAFFNGMLGNSIWGDCLDGKDLGVRLDAYGWDIEYCYFEQ